MYISRQRPVLPQQSSRQITQSVAPVKNAEAEAISPEEKTGLMRQFQYQPTKNLPADYEIVSHVSNDGEEFRVAGKRVEGDASSFHVMDVETGKAICTLKRIPASRRGDVFVWMHPEDSGLKGGRPRGGENYPASGNAWIDLMAEIMTEVNTHIYHKYQTMGYNAKLKSGNKYNTNIDGDYERSYLADSAISTMRGTTPLSDPELFSKTFGSKAHNSFEVSLITRHILRARNVEARLVNLASADHFVAICGRIPDDLPEDMQQWPEDTYVCDSYANIRCSAREYPQNFIEKMNKWASVGKKLFFSPEKEWIMPNDQRFIHEVLHGRKEFGDKDLFDMQ